MLVKRSYQPSPHFEENDSQSQTSHQNSRGPGRATDGPSSQKPNEDKGRQKGKGKGHGKSVQGETEDIDWALSTQGGMSSDDESEVDEPCPVGFKRLRYIDELEHCQGQAFSTQAEMLTEDEPLELIELDCLDTVSVPSNSMHQKSWSSIVELRGG